MAPSYAKANEACQSAVHRLIKTVFFFMECHLPPVEGETVSQPGVRPPHRASVLPCDQCETELNELEPNDRQGHQCTHHVEKGTGSRAESVADEPERSQTVAKSVRQRQPDAGVLRQDIEKVDEKFDAFTVALSVFCSIMEDEAEINMYEQYLVMRADYVGWIKDRAHDAIFMIESVTVNAQTNPVSRTDDSVPQLISQPGTSHGGSNVTEVIVRSNQVVNTGDVNNSEMTDLTPATTGATNHPEIDNGRTQNLASALKGVTGATGVTDVSRDATGSNQIAMLC